MVSLCPLLLLLLLLSRMAYVSQAVLTVARLCSVAWHLCAMSILAVVSLFTGCAAQSCSALSCAGTRSHPGRQQVRRKGACGETSYGLPLVSAAVIIFSLVD